MIQVRINDKEELEELGIESCTEMHDAVSNCSYLESGRGLVPVYPKIRYQTVTLRVPRRKNGIGSMAVDIGTGGRKIIYGHYGELMAVFVLGNQYQQGVLVCRYCKRKNLFECCQMEGFFREMVA